MFCRRYEISLSLVFVFLILLLSCIVVVPWRVSHICQISGSCSEATLCCIFHLRDFHCCNNHTISAFCQEPGQAELIMFVLARFLAHWTTAIVLNSVLPLIEHSHFLALTQEIKFLSKGPFWSPYRESKETGIGRKNKDVDVLWKEKMPYAGEEKISWQGFDVWNTALCSWIQDGSLYSQPGSVVKILLGCSKMFILVMLSALTICSGWG